MLAFLAVYYEEEGEQILYWLEREETTFSTSTLNSTTKHQPKPKTQNIDKVNKPMADMLLLLPCNNGTVV